MRKLTLIILLLISILTNAQECDCDGLINWQSDKIINVLSKPGGSKIDELQNDATNENFLIFRIMETKGDYLKVIINKSFDHEPVTGWIKKGKEVGLYARNYEPGKKLNFYSKPDFNSEIKMKLDEYLPEFYQILDCKNKWAKVKLNYKNKTYKGWIEPEMQCASPYTTCN